MQRKLIDYLPSVLKELEEFKQIMTAEQKQVDELWNFIHAILNEAFVDTAEDIGLKRWESILNITPLDTDTAEVRRMRIHARMLEDVPYTWNSFKQMLGGLCGEDGYTLELNSKEYTLVIKVALTSKKVKDEVAKMADRVVPANLILDIDLMYNTYEMLENYTYEELETRTYGQIRNEVLSNAKNR